MILTRRLLPAVTVFGNVCGRNLAHSDVVFHDGRSSLTLIFLVVTASYIRRAGRHLNMGMDTCACTHTCVPEIDYMQVDARCSRLLPVDLCHMMQELRHMHSS